MLPGVGVSSVLTKRFADYENPDSWAARLRARRLVDLIELIRDANTASGSVSILDIGGTGKYWAMVPEKILDECDVQVTVLNLPGSEARAVDQDRLRFVEGDGCDLARFADGEFDIAHSNSVIEHVGGWPRMRQFASEVRRVGQRYLVQTPNFWFPVEPHFVTPGFQWLPEPARVWMLMHLRLGHTWGHARDFDTASTLVAHTQLLTPRMMRWLFPDAELCRERVFGMTKSMTAVRG
jgi:hypothetical protein